MEKFTTLDGVAAPLPMINVDTDKIIPKQYLKTIKRTGLGKELFDELRYREDGSENPDFILNQPAYRKAKMLVAGENFGCGSARASMRPGRCSISASAASSPPSFADIFYNNCFKNGILPIMLPQEIVDQLMDDARKAPMRGSPSICEQQNITRPDGGVVHFDIDPFRKHCLLNGLDDIGLTLQKAPSIASFEEKNKLSQPWLWS